MKIISLSAAELISYYYTFSKEGNVKLVFCNNRMEESLKQIFPNIDVVRLYPIHLSSKKLKKISSLIKNIFKIYFNYLKISYYVFKYKNNLTEAYYSHNFSLEINQVLKISNFYGIKLIYIPTYNYKDNIEIEYNSVIKSIYQKLFLNELTLVKNSRFDNDNVIFNLNPNKTISPNKINTNYLSKEDILDPITIKKLSKNIAIIIDADLISLESLYGKIDINATKLNLVSYYNEYLVKYDLILFKKRIEQYQKKELYFYDLLEKNSKHILIKRFIPAEYTLGLSDNIYSVFSYNVNGIKIHKMNNLVEFINPSKWVKEFLL